MTVKIVETKVLAGAAGAGIGGALGNFLLWLLGITVWHTSATAAASSSAVAAVPPAVSALLAAVLPVTLAAVGGYLAPHTSRPDLASLSVPAADVVALVSSAGHLIAGEASTLPTGAPVNPSAPVRTLTDPTVTPSVLWAPADSVAVRTFTDPTVSSVAGYTAATVTPPAPETPAVASDPAAPTV
jgi:hypothetical protein